MYRDIEKDVKTFREQGDLLMTVPAGYAHHGARSILRIAEGLDSILCSKTDDFTAKKVFSAPLIGLVGTVVKAYESNVVSRTQADAILDMADHYKQTIRSISGGRYKDGVDEAIRLFAIRGQLEALTRGYYVLESEDEAPDLSLEYPRGILEKLSSKGHLFKNTSLEGVRLLRAIFGDKDECRNDSGAAWAIVWGLKSSIASMIETCEKICQISINGQYDEISEVLHRCQKAFKRKYVYGIAPKSIVPIYEPEIDLILKCWSECPEKIQGKLLGLMYYPEMELENAADSAEWQVGRVERLVRLNAPDVIMINERRMLADKQAYYGCAERFKLIAAGDSEAVKKAIETYLKEIVENSKSALSALKEAQKDGTAGDGSDEELQEDY